MSRHARLAAAALLLAAADQPPTPVQQVPTAAAMSILGHLVDGQDGKDMARIVDVLIDASGQPVAAVIDFGGFLGMGTRRIAVDWKSLKFNPADKEHPITLDLSMDKIRAAPEYKDQQSAPVVSPPAPAVPTMPAAAAAQAAPAPPAASEPTPSEPAPPAKAE